MDLFDVPLHATADLDRLIGRHPAVEFFMVRELALLWMYHGDARRLRRHGDRLLAATDEGQQEKRDECTTLDNVKS
jgi:hypothetical protein